MWKHVTLFSVLSRNTHTPGLINTSIRRHLEWKQQAGKSVGLLTISLTFVIGNTRTVLLAGSALKTQGSFANGLTPLRAAFAGFLALHLSITGLEGLCGQRLCLHLGSQHEHSIKFSFSCVLGHRRQARRTRRSRSRRNRRSGPGRRSRRNRRWTSLEARSPRRRWRLQRRAGRSRKWTDWQNLAQARRTRGGHRRQHQRAGTPR